MTSSLSQQSAEDVAGELENRLHNGIDSGTHDAAKIAWRRIGVEDNTAQDPRHNNCPVFAHDR